MDLGLNGKLAVVTAASSGLGYATAAALVAEGAHVAICSRSEKRVRHAAERLKETNPNGVVLPFEADVSSDEALRRFFEQATTNLGGLDILVCNAGGPPAGSFTSLDEVQWDSTYKLTLQSVVRSVRYALPDLHRRGGGRILVITGSSVKRSLPNLLLSNVFRPAVQGLCKSLSLELAGDNIQVNCLAPGRISTERTDELDRARAEKLGVTFEEVRAESVLQVPMGRFGTPEEFGRVAAFLCSEAVCYVNGSTILVDGGSVNCL